MKYSPFFFLALGAAGALARAELYAVGVDSSGLLTPNHPLYLLCWGLTVIAVAAAVFCTFRCRRVKQPAAAWPAALCAALTAGGILSAVVPTLGQLGDALEYVWAALGLLSAPAMLIAGALQWRRKRLPFFLHGVLCLFFAVHLVCRYRAWSGNPQLADYDFQLLACVCLLLTAYQHTARDVGMAQRTMVFFSLMAGFFCLLCCSRSDFPLLYLTGGLWALDSLGQLGASRPRENPGEGETA